MKIEKEMKADVERIGSKEQWYDGAVDYWNKQTTDLDGILGGYGRVHPCDIDTSRNMIVKFSKEISGFNKAIDCGAGWGRITKDVLVPKFKVVDLLDPAEEQVKKAREYVPEVRNFFVKGL